MDTARVASRTARIAARHPLVRWDRAMSIAATVGFAIVLGRAVFYFAQMPDRNGAVGVDYRLYVGAAQRWLDSGQFYLPAQVAVRITSTTSPRSSIRRRSCTSSCRSPSCRAPCTG